MDVNHDVRLAGITRLAHLNPTADTPSSILGDLRGCT
jgi:hypothetical protein